MTNKTIPTKPIAMRKVTFWVPDTRDPEFQAEYRRQMAVIADHDRRTGSGDRLETDEDALRGWV
jgi:hypothetical protein